MSTRVAILCCLLLRAACAPGQVANAALAEQTIDQIDLKGNELYKARCYEKATLQFLRTYWNKSSTRLCGPFVRRLAESVLQSEMSRDTARYFIDQYLEMQPFDAEAYWLSALAHYHGHDFGKARRQLDYFARVVADSAALAKQLPWAQERVPQLRRWIDDAERVLNEPHCPWQMFNMGPDINTRNNELNPYMINGGTTLVWSCDDRFDRENVINVFNVKWSEQSDLGWTPGRKIGGTLNTPADEYPSGLQPGGFLFCSNRGGDFALFSADYKGKGRCAEPAAFEYPIDMQGSEVGGWLTPAADTLYFSGTLANGKLDIFYSIKGFGGLWMTPRPIPGLVNTQEYDENYPYITNDGRRLYFASDRPGSMGGYDLFYSDYDEAAQAWGEPHQLPYPLNDTYDNMTICFSPSGRYAYVSMLRPDSEGMRDLYALLTRPEVGTSATLRYHLLTRGADHKSAPLTKQPKIELQDEMRETLTPIKLNLNTSAFVVNLEPGRYDLTVELPGYKPYTERIVVQEREYDPKPLEREITLPIIAPPSPKK